VKTKKKGALPVKWKRSVLEKEFERQLREAAFPKWEEEHKFHPTRKWRMDFAWPKSKVACEIQGGTWRGGRHTRGAGFEGDCDKFNSALLMGWKVYKFTSRMVKSGAALAVMKEAQP